MPKKSKTALIEMDRELYRVVKAFVEKNHFDYPSIKYFIEKSIMSTIGFKQYDIEGIKQENIEYAPLNKLVGKPTSSFVPCMVCNKLFLKRKKDNSPISKICPNCKNTISHFAHLFNKEEKK